MPFYPLIISDGSSRELYGLNTDTRMLVCLESFHATDATLRSKLESSWPSLKNDTFVDMTAKEFEEHDMDSLISTINDFASKASEEKKQELAKFSEDCRNRFPETHALVESYLVGINRPAGGFIFIDMDSAGYVCMVPDDPSSLFVEGTGYRMSLAPHGSLYQYLHDQTVSESFKKECANAGLSVKDKAAVSFQPINWDVVKMTFGKHKGVAVSQLEPGYASYISNKVSDPKGYQAWCVRACKELTNQRKGGK